MTYLDTYKLEHEIRECQKLPNYGLNIVVADQKRADIIFKHTEQLCHPDNVSYKRQTPDSGYAISLKNRSYIKIDNYSNGETSRRRYNAVLADQFLPKEYVDAVLRAKEIKYIERT